MKFTLSTTILTLATLTPVVFGAPAPVPNPDATDLEKRDLFARISLCSNYAWSCNGNACVDFFTHDRKKQFQCPDKVGAGPNGDGDGWYEWFPENNDVMSWGFLYKGGRGPANGIPDGTAVANCYGGQWDAFIIDCYEI